MKRLLSIVIVSVFIGQLAYGLPSFIENSPFLPPAVATAIDQGNDGPPSLSQLQMRGITKMKGEFVFSIYDPKTNKSKWRVLGQEKDGLIVRSYDEGKKTIVIHSVEENLSREMQMNAYTSPSPGGATQTRELTSNGGRVPSTRATGDTITRSNRQRPTQRNLETLRKRRKALAEKLRQKNK